MVSKEIKLDQIKGCLLGCAFGDALGAKYEGGYLERALWFLLGRTKGRMRYTDDTQMSLDIVESILECGQLDQNHLAMQFANSYRWSRGYGPGAAKVLKKIGKGVHWNQANTSQFKDGSYGNGAAMRAPILALFYDGNELKEKVKLTSEITHTHPEAIEGAYLVALTTSMALKNKASLEILDELIKASEIKLFQEKFGWLNSLFYDGKFSSTQIIEWFGNGIEARNSCVTAIGMALYFRNSSFLKMFGHIKNGKGDVDTIAAMAGAIWGAFKGIDAIDGVNINHVEVGESIECLASQVYAFNKNIESDEC
jgi:poly(ADP-ribose) glycohydrolase ARH3